MSNSVVIELDCTLEDDAWKDSFDKLLDERPVLQELKLLKKKVRASFNNDSSVENSKEIGDLLEVPKQRKQKRLTISTPKGKLPKQPFKCSISPITSWARKILKSTENIKPPQRTRKLQSTVIHPEIVVIDDDSVKEITALTTEKPPVKNDSLDVFLENGAKKLSKGRQTQRNVAFDTKIIDEPKRSATENRQGNTERAVKSLEKRTSRKRSSREKGERRSKKDLTLQPGKWRKSFCALKRSQQTELQRRTRSQRFTAQLETIDDESVIFIGTIIGGVRKTILIKPDLIHEIEHSFVHIRDYKERVLQYCNQESPLHFEEAYAETAMRDCYKIGEGVYGEVFIKKELEELVVCKIIPIEGTLVINGEAQKTFEQILPEIVITQELCNLKDGGKNVTNVTNGFAGIKKVACVQGKYPEHLLDRWKEYDEKKGSENDPPDEFSDEQLFIVLELEFAGKDLESFVFNNAEQSYAALEQIVFTLAVAENALQFEHRDLHWGNVLVCNTDEAQLVYKIAGEEFKVATNGIKTTIIDYTLSRITYDNHCFYNDLAQDEELFTAKGDYQFDIYRMMRDVLGKNWERFEPKTNIFWISYIISKMVHGVSYKNERSKTHTQYLRKMRSLKNEVLEYDSAWHFVKHMRSAS